MLFIRPTGRRLVPRASRALRGTPTQRSGGGGVVRGARISSSNTTSSSGATTAPTARSWEDVTQRFYASLSTLALTSSQRHGHWAYAYTSAVAAMEECLRCDRPAEAIDVYMATCSSGLDFVGTTQACAPSLEVLAQQALHSLQHRTQQGLAVALLLAAEGELPTAAPSPHPPRHPISTAEQFRIALRQHTALLRSAALLTHPLGRDYLLTEIRTVAESPVLCEECEIPVLLLLSEGVLTHPFAFASPSSPWARRDQLFEHLYPCHHGGASPMLGGSGGPAGSLSPAQLEGVVLIESAVRPVRHLCSSALLFLATIAPNWDALFLRRAAQVLVLPDSAHSLFPTHYEAARPRRARGGSANVTALPCAWTDPSCELFGPAVACSSTEDAAKRVEAIVRRRLSHDVIIPDTSFVMSRFHQLRQLGKHREVVLTHGVVLELVSIASDSTNPRRFHARGVLREIMNMTTTGQHNTYRDGLRGTATESAKRTHSLVASHVQNGGGVTVLGLQDELALLDASPERFLVGPVDATRGVGIGALSAVLVAKQLERLIAAQDRGSSFADAFTAESSIDTMVAGIVQHSMAEWGTTQLAPRGHREAQLFQTRRRAFWAHVPVVLATTSESTRAMAYTVGVRMYPPVSPES